jgi:hypothetical protein
VRWLWSQKPQAAATSDIDSRPSRSVSFATSMRRFMSHRCGAIPTERLNAREKWAFDNLHSRASFSTTTPPQVGVDHILRASLLPGCEPTPDRLRHWPHASIGLCDMHPERQQNVIDKQGLLSLRDFFLAR